MVKPIIGVVPLYDKEKDSFWMLPGYMHGIAAAGGIAVMLPMTDSAVMVQQLSDQFDGFLFTGGQDVSPTLYQEQKKNYCGEAICVM